MSIIIILVSLLNTNGDTNYGVNLIMERNPVKLSYDSLQQPGRLLFALTFLSLRVLYSFPLLIFRLQYIPLPHFSLLFSNLAFVGNILSTTSA